VRNPVILYLTAEQIVRMHDAEVDPSEPLGSTSRSLNRRPHDPDRLRSVRSSTRLST
jgi:hypothetical protein